MRRFSAGWWLRTVLLLDGIVCATAVFAVFIPVSWMASVAEWMELGCLPPGPVIEYLARTTSAFYAMHGALELYAATDVRRHANIVRFLGVSSIVFGLCLLGIGGHAGLPWYWTPVEGPGIAFLGGLLLVLVRKDQVEQTGR